MIGISPSAAFPAQYRSTSGRRQDAARDPQARRRDHHAETRSFRSALNTLGVLDGLNQQGISPRMIDLGGDVTGNGISKLVFTILSAIFETERDRIRERIADVKSDQKTRGRFFGGSRPFGWQIAADGSLEPLEGERKALLAMRRMKKAGKKPAHDRDRNAGARVCNLTPGRQEGAGEMGRQVR